MFLIYSGFCIFSFIIVYIYIPETKNIPVEEIGGLFGDMVAVHLSEERIDSVDKQLEVHAIEDVQRPRAESVA